MRRVATAPVKGRASSLTALASEVGVNDHSVCVHVWVWGGGECAYVRHELEYCFRTAKCDVLLYVTINQLLLYMQSRSESTNAGRQ